MAYFNLLASVPEPDIKRLCQDPTLLVRPSMVLGASHLLGYWVQVQPLGGLLGRALDGGQSLHPDLWHPLRPPGFHPPPVVAELAMAIGQAWETAIGSHPLPDSEWLGVEVGRLLRVFRHAATSDECIVSMLDSPADQERSSRMRPLWSPRWDG